MPVANTAAELFNTKVPAVLVQHADMARGINAVFYFNISGTNGGQWTMDLKSNPPTCQPGKVGTPEATVEISYDNFKNILLNPTLAMQLYFQGKLNVQGNPMLLAKLQPLLLKLA